jgi:hypothetical protein
MAEPSAAGSRISSGTGLVRRLERGPTATTVTVKDLVQKVHAGEVRVPRFQRPLRWKQSDVLRLLDSIWRGYPVGSLLFWKREAPEDTITVGGARFSAPAVREAWWVIDGQQRTTALAATLLDLEHGGDRRWVASFDPAREEFRADGPKSHEIGRIVPMSVLGDLRRLGRWLREVSRLDEPEIDLVERAQERILGYSIPAYVVDTDDEQALRGVFARLNSTGSRMRADEVFQALLGAPSQGAAGSLDLDELQRECGADGFGMPPRAEIFKAILAMAGRDPTRHLDDTEIDRGHLPSREDAAEALARTRDFLMRRCGIPMYGLIPYPVAFFILARWFHVHGTSDDPTLVRLARWLWRGAITGVHQRAEVSKMREQVRDIDDDEAASLDRLLARVDHRPAAAWTLQPFHSRSGRSRIETLALLEERPRDHLGYVVPGELVSGGEEEEESQAGGDSTGGRVAREVFASRDLQALSGLDADLAKTVANRVVLGGVHTGLQSEIRGWTGQADDTLRASHLIDRDAFDALVRKDVGTFLRRRAEAVRGAIERFVQARAAWDEPNLKPLQVYFDAGEK